MTQRRKVGLDFGAVENMGATTGQTLQAGPQSLVPFASGSNKDMLSSTVGHGGGLRTQIMLRF